MQVFTSYIADNNPYVIGENGKEIIETAGNTSNKSKKWFSNNQMRVYPYQCSHLATLDEELKFVSIKLLLTTAKTTKC